MSNFTHQQSTSASTSSAVSSKTVTYGSTVTAGNLLLVAISGTKASGGAPTYTVTDSLGNTFLSTGARATIGTLAVELFWCTGCLGGSNTVTVTPSSSATLSISIHEYLPASNFALLDSTNISSGSGTNITCTGPTLFSSSELIFAVAGSLGDDLTITGTGGSWNERANIGNTSSVNDLESQDQLNVSTTANPSWTLGSSGSWAAVTASFGIGTAQTFTSSGTWTCPTGVNSAVFQAWGAGGTGGTGNDDGGGDYYGGGGGGGGAYALGFYATTPSNNYTVTVGATESSTTADSSSVTHSATTLVLGKGGDLGGFSGGSSAGLGTNGGSASSSTGYVKYSGAFGGNAATSQAAGGGGGSSAGTSSNGNIGGNAPGNATGGTGGSAPTGGGAGGTGSHASSNNPVGGSVPGGGGGGGGYPDGVGAAGASGQVIINYLVYNAIVTATDAPTISESALRTLTALRIDSDDPQTSESDIRLVQLFRSITDAPQTSESTSFISINQNSGTDHPQTSESVARVLALIRSITDAPITSESVTRVLTLIRSITDTTTTSELVTRILGLLRSLTDTPITSEVVTRSLILLRIASDSASMSESIKATPSELHKTDNMATSDVAIRTITSSRIATDSVSISELTYDTIVANAMEITTLSDVVTRVGVFNLNIVHNISFSDSGVSSTHSVNVIDILSFTDQLLPSNIWHEFVNNIINFNQIISTPSSIPPIVDIIVFTDNVQFVGPIVVNASDSISFSDSIVSSGAIFNISIIDIVSLFDYASRIQSTQTPFNTFSISQSVASSKGYSQGLALTQTISYEVSKGFVHSFNISDSVIGNVIRNLTQTDGISFQQTVVYYLITTDVNNRIIYDPCTYSPQISPGNYSCTPPSATPPTLTPRTTIVLNYPVVSPTATVTLRNPELEDVEKDSYNRIIRESRGGDLQVFRDPEWPKISKLTYTIKYNKWNDVENFLNFVQTSLGQQVQLVDYYSRTWTGIIFIPEKVTTNASRFNRELTFDFEGALS